MKMDKEREEEMIKMWAYEIPKWVRKERKEIVGSDRCVCLGGGGGVIGGRGGTNASVDTGSAAFDRAPW